jgi:GNAT superfamily N-acetyltransferase
MLDCAARSSWRIVQRTPAALIDDAALYAEHVRLRAAVLWSREGLSDDTIQTTYLNGLDRRAVHFLAIAEGASPELLGMAQLDPVTARVRQVLVREECARQGIGRALIDAVVMEAQQRGFPFLQVEAWHGTSAFFSFPR